MDFLPLLLNFFQAIAWPFVTLIVFQYFAGSLRDLLITVNHALTKGGIKVTTSGVEIPGPQENIETINDLLGLPGQKPQQHEDSFNQKEAEPLTSQPQEVEPILDDVQTNQLIDEVQDAIDNLLKKKEKAVSEKELLKKLLCDAYINLFFERTFQKILPSQLELLHKVAQQRDQHLSLHKIQGFFQHHFPEQSIMFYHKWLDFLERLHFIHRTSNQFLLTPEGREFLKYLEKRKYTTK